MSLVLCWLTTKLDRERIFNSNKDTVFINAVSTCPKNGGVAESIMIFMIFEVCASVTTPTNHKPSLSNYFPMATGGQEEETEQPVPPPNGLRRSESAPSSLMERVYASYYRFKYGEYEIDRYYS